MQIFIQKVLIFSPEFRVFFLEFLFLVFFEQLDKLIAWMKLEYLTEEVEAPDTDPDHAEDEDSDPEIRELEGK